MNAPSIVFLHGGGTGPWSWGPVVERLTGFRCLVPALPDHGGNRTPFSMRAAVNEVAELIRQEAGGRAHVVGLSLGGQVGLALLAAHPSLVARAVLSGVLVRRMLMAPLVVPFGWLVWPLKAWEPGVKASFARLELPAEHYPAFLGDARALTFPAFRRMMTANLGFRLPEGAKRIETPTLVVAGAKEPGIVRASARDIVARCPGVRGAIVAGMGHAWNLQAPALFADTVRAWIEGAALPAGVVALT